jgi:DNA-binding transcriptional LysR family regulator
VLLLSPHHPLAARAAVTLDDLAGEPFVLPPDTLPPAFRSVWGAGRDAGPTGASQEQIVALVAEGHGLALVPAGMPGVRGGGPVVVREVAGLDPVALHLCWRADDDSEVLGDGVRAVRAAARVWARQRPRLAGVGAA